MRSTQNLKSGFNYHVLVLFKLSNCPAIPFNRGPYPICVHSCFSDDSYTFPEVFPIAGLLPNWEDLTEYFHYEGSLTTPLCNEAVHWIVYQKPIEVSANQVLYRLLHKILTHGDTNSV